MEQAILFGNGFNRLVRENPSWEDLLQKIAIDRDASDISMLPPTFKYEYSFLHSYTQREKSGNKEFDLKKSLADELKAIERSRMYDELLDSGVSIFITPNYDYAFSNKLQAKEGYSDCSESIYSIHRWRMYRNLNNKNDIVVYQYHGEINYPKTIVLGYDHYCGTLGKLDKYIKGEYSFGGSIRTPSMFRRLSGKETLPRYDDLGLKLVGHSNLLSWADTLFYTDLHIIGFGMDFSELDIWWLLDRRIRLKKEYGDNVVKNKIFYYVCDPITLLNGAAMQKLHLLREYDVEVITHTNLSELMNGKPDYESIYCQQLESLKINVKKNQIR